MVRQSRLTSEGSEGEGEATLADRGATDFSGSILVLLVIVLRLGVPPDFLAEIAVEEMR